MAEPDFNLMIEHLKAIRSEQARTNERLDRVERRLDTMNEHIGALVKSEASVAADYTSLERRIARLEQRLELVGGAG